MNTAEAVAWVRLLTHDAWDRGPLYWSNADQLDRLMVSKAVRGAAQDGCNDAEDFEEAVYRATQRWTLADLANAATAAVYLAEERYIRQWLWYSRADLQGELARTVVQVMVRHGWEPTDL